MWRGQEARLYLHYENGLQLLPAVNDVINGGTVDGEKSQPKPFWQIPFGSLRHSADDGVRLLWLDIGSDQGETVSNSCSLLLNINEESSRIFPHSLNDTTCTVLHRCAVSTEKNPLIILNS